MVRESREGDEPTLESVCGLDPRSYIGGALVGSEEGMAVHPEHFQEVRQTLRDIRLEQENGSWFVVLDFGGDYCLKGSTEFISVQVDGNKQLTISMRYVGVFKILLPETSTKTIERALHEIRARDFFMNN